MLLFFLSSLSSLLSFFSFSLDLSHTFISLAFLLPFFLPSIPLHFSDEKYDERNKMSRIKRDGRGEQCGNLSYKLQNQTSKIRNRNEDNFNIFCVLLHVSVLSYSSTTLLYHTLLSYCVISMSLSAQLSLFRF